LRVSVVGEVVRPGSYYVGPHDTFADVLLAAGGVTYRGHLGGARLERLGATINGDLDDSLELGRPAWDAGLTSGGTSSTSLAAGGRLRGSSSHGCRSSS